MSPWRNFAVAYSSVLAFTFVFQALPPLLRLLSAELFLNNAQSGLLMGAFALPGIALAIPGGRLTDRFGIKLISTVSLLVMLSGAVGSAFAVDFWSLGLARVVAGMGGVVLVVAAGSLVSNSFSGRQLGIAMGFYGTGLPVGTIIGFSLFGFIANAFGWRTALVASGLTALLPLVLVYLFLAETDSATGADGGGSVFATLRRTWPMGMVWLWFNAAVIAFITFAPKFLADSGFAPEVANFVAGLVMWGALVVSPIVGLFLTDIRRKAGFIAVGALLTGAIMTLFPLASTQLVPLVIVLGIAAALGPPAVFALPADLVGPKSQGVAFGIMSTSLNLGILVGPFLVGVARDQTGSYTLGFYLMAAFSFLAALSTLPLFKINTQATFFSADSIS